MPIKSLPPFGGRPGVRNTRVLLSSLLRSLLDACLPPSLRTQLPLMYSQPPPKSSHYPRSKPLHAARQSSLGPLLRSQPSSCASGSPCAHPLGTRLPLLNSDCGSGPARAPFFGQPSFKHNAAHFASPCRPSVNPARPFSCAVGIPGRWAYSTPNSTLTLSAKSGKHVFYNEFDQSIWQKYFRIFETQRVLQNSQELQNSLHVSLTQVFTARLCSASPSNGRTTTTILPTICALHTTSHTPFEALSNSSTGSSSVSKARRETHGTLLSIPDTGSIEVVPPMAKTATAERRATTPSQTFEACCFVHGEPSDPGNKLQHQI